MFGGFGIGELLIVLFIVLLLFGARKIPQIARGLGEGIREFKSSVSEDEPDQLNDGGDEELR